MTTWRQSGFPPTLPMSASICLMKNQPGHVAKRFAQCHVGDVVMSAITCAEM